MNDNRKSALQEALEAVQSNIGEEITDKEYRDAIAKLREIVRQLEQRKSAGGL